MRNRSAKGGFTIVELMVTLAVAGILMGFALPAFNDFVRQRSLSSSVNDFVLAVTYARSEAARRGRTVSVQAMDASDDTNEWGPGYCVVEGTPGDCNDPLRSFEATDTATINAVNAGFHGTSTLSFNARGMLTPRPAAAGAIEICSTDEDITRGRVVSIEVIGRAVADDLECHGA